MFRIGKKDRTGKTMKFSELIGALIEKLDVKEEFTLERMKQDWPSIAGGLAYYSHPDGVKDHILFVKATHPTVANEIVMLKTAIIARFNEKYDSKIRDMRLVR